jgi:hypothetical protein
MTFKKYIKNLLIWSIIVLSIIGIYQIYQANYGKKPYDIEQLSSFLDQVQKDRVKKVSRTEVIHPHLNICYKMQGNMFSLPFYKG